MNRIFTIGLLLLSLITTSGQSIITDLYGFRLGQYRVSAVNEFGKPNQQESFDDGYEYEVFILNPDTSLFLVFEYAAGKTDIIFSIQISGTDTTTDIGFKGLKLGANKKLVEQVLGKPDSKEKIGIYGQKWNYDKTNYSIEISRKGKLSSVKIINTYENDSTNLNKLPTFDAIIKTMRSDSNSLLMTILAPDIEIYYEDKIIMFQKSVKKEIETDYSKVFQTIRELSVGLDQINTSDPNTYQENIRISFGQKPKHVIKINSKHFISEIVFEYINGQYLIWEINTR